MKYLRIILFSFFLVSLGACEKTEEINNSDTQVGISRVTFFPLVSLKGPRFIAISVGSTYTELGIDATAGGVAVPYTTSGTVNTSVAGIYTITYSAINADGFSASIRRTIAVYTTDAGAAAHDLSGNYLRSATGVTSTWTRIAPGVYTVLNPGGTAGIGLTVIAINPTGFTIKIPTQPADDGSPFTSDLEVYTNSSIPTYTWKLVNPGYGTGLRTFVKI